jgi:hypothetical protein
MRVRESVFAAVVIPLLISLRSSQPAFDLPISGAPIRPLRQPAGFGTGEEAMAAFRPAVVNVRPSIACGVWRSKPSRFDIPPYVAHDAKGGPNLPAGQQDISLYVDSTGALTYAIELRASRPFYRPTGGAHPNPNDTAQVAYRATSEFTVIETDLLARRIRAFNYVRGEYQRGIEGTLEQLDGLASLEHPVARAQAALATCKR